MSLTISVLLAGALTFPVPPDPVIPPNIGLPSSPDLYEEEPSIIALEVSTIRGRLKRLGYYPITSMEFERGRWTIYAYQGQRMRRLRVDPDSGYVLSDRAAR